MPCLNGASCVNVNPNNYECTCVTGYEGKNCSLKTGGCGVNTCQNGATCEVYIANSIIINVS